MKEWRKLNFLQNVIFIKVTLLLSPFLVHKIIISCPIAGLLPLLVGSLFLRIVLKLFITTDRPSHPKTTLLCSGLPAAATGKM